MSGHPGCDTSLMLRPKINRKKHVIEQQRVQAGPHAQIPRSHNQDILGWNLCPKNADVPGSLCAPSFQNIAVILVQAVSTLNPGVN